MNDDPAFAARIHERYPEGLTGILAIGGTRTAYVLERQRDRSDPGQIDDYADYAHYTLTQYLRLLEDFFALGGQYLVVPPLGFQAFYERGDAYTQIIIDYTLQLTGSRACEFYRQHAIDPYFVGIDTLLALPDSDPIRKLGLALERFHQEWPYADGRRKVIWEIAPIPLYSYWRAEQTMPAEAQEALAAALDTPTDMREMFRQLFSFYAQASLGTDIPVPHFYVGTNRNGDLKLRSMIPISLIAGGPFRLFYLSYPSLFMTRDVLRTIIEDVAFGGKAASQSYDYSGRYTAQQAQAEYQRVMAMVHDPDSVIGLKRRGTGASHEGGA